MAGAAAAVPPSPRGYLYQMLAIRGWSSLPWLWRIRVPARVPRGHGDPIIPTINARVMASPLPRARLVDIDDRHLFMPTSAEETAGCPRDFLAEPTLRTATAASEWRMMTTTNRREEPQS